jgi:hypothetical protein
MKRLNKLVLVAALFLSAVSPAAGQVDGLRDTTLVVPAESLAKVIAPLLPFKLDMGRNFIGSFFVQSIKDIRIEKDRILFSSLIHGEDIKYATKIGNQVVNFVVGDVNLPNQWEVHFNFDKRKKVLLLKPFAKGPADAKGLSQGDALLNSLFEAFSGIEYPVELSSLQPLTSEIYRHLLTLDTDIADIYGAGNKLFIELTPTVRIQPPKKE